MRPLRVSTAAGRSRRARRSVALLLSGLVLFAVPPHAAVGQDSPTVRPRAADPNAAHIAEAARRFGVPSAWIRAVMRAESAGQARAISSAGAMGLMQIMPATWAELRLRHRLGADPFDPRDNILAGAAYMRELHDRYGAPGFLAAYNAGPRRYEQHLAGRPLPAETRAYVAALAPLVDGEIDEPAAALTRVDPSSWTRSPLFVAQLERNATDDQPQRDASSGEPGTARVERSPTPLADRTVDLFVARTVAGGPR